MTRLAGSAAQLVRSVVECCLPFMGYKTGQKQRNTLNEKLDSVNTGCKGPACKVMLEVSVGGSPGCCIC